MTELRADGVFAPRFVETRFATKALTPVDSNVVLDACPACGQGPFDRVIALVTRSGASVVERGLCAACGHLAFKRMPSERWFEAFYREEFETVNAPPSSPPKAYKAGVLDLLVPRMGGRASRILDVGCGYGSTLQNFRDLGHEHLYGIEPSARRAGVAQSAGFHVAQCSAEAALDQRIISEGAPFDVIYSWHAFEHVFDVRKAMANLVTLLAPGGLLFVCVPHAQAEHIVQMGHYLPHIHSFSNSSLRTLMQSHDLTVVYEDSSLTMIGRKERNATSGLSDGRATPRERWRAKFIRDFDLRKNLQLDSDDAWLWYSDYRGGHQVMEASFGRFDAVRDKVRLQVAEKLLTNAGTPRSNAVHRLGLQWLTVATRHNEPFMVGSARFELPSPSTLPTLDFVYGDADASAWYK